VTTLQRHPVAGELSADAVIVPLRLAATGRAAPMTGTGSDREVTDLATMLGLTRVGDCSIVPSTALGDWRARLVVLTVVSDGPDRIGSVGHGVAAAVRQLRRADARRVAVAFGDPASPGFCRSDIGRAVVESALLAAYSYDAYRTRPRSAPDLQFAGIDEADERAGRITAEATNLARDLVNTPAEDLSPAGLAERCRKLGAARGIPVRVLDEAGLAEGGYGGLVGVGRGSANPPRLVVLGEPERPGRATALVGKGITFDSGGLSLKESMPMLTMKCDMGGAAAVLATMVAAADLGVGADLVGYLACAENSVGGRAYRPGDVLRHRNGTTVEVTDTDAEGRLVLADALALAAERRPARIIDIATLTGATGLGPDLWGVMGTAPELSRELLAAGEAAGEPGWELPIWDGYRDSLHSDVADLRNYDPDARWGHGAILGALFLREFTGGIPWAHLDTAATAFRPKESDAWAAGATGSPVRTLVRWLCSRTS
jgi:leucyl aminopeptidase